MMATQRDDATLILVTPVWKDSRRLAAYGRELADELARRASAVHWVIADDGSGPEEATRLQAQLEEYRKTYPHVSLHLAGVHRGKGAVVREAWNLFPEADWSELHRVDWLPYRLRINARFVEDMMVQLLVVRKVK